MQQMNNKILGTQEISIPSNDAPVGCENKDSSTFILSYTDNMNFTKAYSKDTYPSTVISILL